jgi:hypothetical protein
MQIRGVIRQRVRFRVWYRAGIVVVGLIGRVTTNEIANLAGS